MVVRKSRGNSPASGSSLRSAASDPGLSSGNPDDTVMQNNFVSPVPGSSSSFDMSMTRPLGSRGSLCDDNLDPSDSINVVVRCRPLNEKEIKRGDESILTYPGEGQVWVNVDGSNGKDIQKPKVFTYNVVFEPEATQGDILEHSGTQKLIDMAIDGFSCTVFCYGQTGSGKTHTLTGPPNLFTDAQNRYSEFHGLIYRSFVYISSTLDNIEDKEFTIKASFLEIYNEKVIDLLNLGTNQKPLQVRWSKKKRNFFVENLFSIECYEFDDLVAVLEEGLNNRAVASHNMNEFSSRSHTILTVEITSEQKAEEGVVITKNGKINFVDLAGSEMTKKTNSEGKTLEEANNINKSLMVLGTCIANLSDPKKKDGHIPYRDSKLTKLLAGSLAGSGVTLMIACVSPARSNMSETLNTLRYASRAKRIRTKPIVIMDQKEKAILQLKREVNKLQEENQHLKMLLDLGNATTPPNLSSFVNGHGISEREITPAPRTDLALAGTVGNFTSEKLRKELQNRRTSLKEDDEKLRSLEQQDLIELLKKYMSENDNVRHENKELQMVTNALMKDQELIAKENEWLTQKLEKIESGSSRTSIGSARIVKQKLDSNTKRRSLSREKEPPVTFEKPKTNGTQVWINPIDGNNTGKPTKQGTKLPPSLNKELHRRQIGRSLTDLNGSTGSSRGSSSGGDEFRSTNSGGKRPMPAIKAQPRHIEDPSPPRARKTKVPKKRSNSEPRASKQKENKKSKRTPKEI